MTGPKKLDAYPKIEGKAVYKPKFKAKGGIGVPRANGKLTSKSPLGR